jgi:putative transposase
MLVKKSFKYRLKLTKEQEQQCNQYAGCCRFIWNRSLALKKELWEKEKKSISQFELNNLLLQWKSEFPWLNEAPSQALQQINKDLDQAYKNFFRRCKSGENPGHPKFKKKGKHDSFRFPQGITLLPSQNNRIGKVRLPKLGHTKFIQSQQIPCIIKHVTISRTAGHWYISFNCDEVSIDSCKAPDAPVGIDRGVVVFAQCSDGSQINSPQPLKRNKEKLARIQRKLSRKNKFSKNWIKQRSKLSRLQSHIANIRQDALHKASTTLAKNHGTIVMEDLKTSNMTRSAKGTLEEPGKNVKAKSGLNRSILDQGWHAFKVVLDYKTKWNGGRLILVDPKYTSQKCSLCGCVSSDNRKKQELFACVSCGHRENADLNAAKNILAAGLAVSACGEAPLGAPVKQEARKRNVAKAA